MLLNQIKEKLTTANIVELSRKLGYNNQENFEKTLDKFLSSSTLHAWLQSGNYDFVNQPHEFYSKISLALGCDKMLINRTLEKEKAIILEEKRFKNSFIFINTNFHRKNEPISVLAFLENTRRISLKRKEEIYFKKIDEILEILSKEIQKHYEAHNEGLPLWGKIASYQAHLEDKIYIFDTNGILQKEAVAVSENRAILNLK